MKVSFDLLWGAFARLPFASRFEGARAVARREVVANLLSLRLLVVALLLGLAIVGGSAGISALASFQPTEDANTVLFVHAVNAGGAGNTAVVFASDAWGRPHVGLNVSLGRLAVSGGGGRPGGAPATEIVASAFTDANGFARFENLTDSSYVLYYTSGREFRTGGFADFSQPPALPFSLATASFDLGQNGSQGDFLLHATDLAGAPLAGAQVVVNGTPLAALDARGYGHVRLPPGEWSVAIRSSAGEVSTTAFVSESAPTALEQGADVVLYVVASFFVPFIVPIATIAVAHDAIARERAQGSIDFVLSRPATRYGVLLGKFVGSAGALLVPVYATLALGALVIGVSTGKPVTFTFLGGILLAVTLYVAAYTLLLLILSTLSKTTGTAVMFGVLLWVLYNIMWGVVVLLVAWAAGLTQADPGFYTLQATTGLFNLNQLYSWVVATSFPGAPADLFTVGGVVVMPSWAPLAASLVWLVALLAVALLVFDRKIAE